MTSRACCGSHWSVRTVLLLALLAPTVAFADVVGPPPSSCPPGHRPSTDHSGPYCRPPPPKSCPAGHLPKVDRTQPYCEPPPTKPCPAGSDWTSLSASDSFCNAASSCALESCSGGQRCVPTSFCLAEVCFRCGHSRVVAACSTQADCPAQSRCTHEYRCDPKNKRVASSYVPPATVVPPRSSRQPAVLPKLEPPHCNYESCPSDTACVPLELCTKSDSNRSWERPKPGVTQVQGSCVGDAKCRSGATCSRLFRCMSASSFKTPPTTPDPVAPLGSSQPVGIEVLPGPVPGATPLPPTGGCGSCAAPSTPTTDWWWLSTGLALLVLALRRGSRATAS